MDFARLPLVYGFLALGVLATPQALPAQAPVKDLGELRIGSAAAAPDPLAALRAAGPALQRSRAAKQLETLDGESGGTAAAKELRQAVELYTLTRVDELRQAIEVLAPQLDDAKPWASEALRARRLVRLAGQLTTGSPEEKEKALDEWDGLFRESLRGGVLAATTLCAGLDALELNAWVVAESTPASALASRVNGWVEAFVPAFPKDATALRRAAHLHAKVGLIARWSNDSRTADDQASRARELDGALSSVAHAPAHDLLMTAQHRLWTGDIAGARTMVWKLEARPPATLFNLSGSPDRVRDDWIRLGLVYHAIGAAHLDTGKRALQQACALPARPSLAEAVLQPPDAASVVLDTELTLLGVRHDERQPGAAREFVFVAKLQHAVAKLVRFGFAEPVALSRLLAAYATASRSDLTAAADALAQELVMHTLTSRWFFSDPKQAAETGSRLAAVVAAEKALLPWLTREPYNGAFEREVAGIVINALHRGLTASVAHSHTVRRGDLAFVAGTTLPSFGVNLTDGKSRAIMPSAFSASWRELQFEVCLGFLDAVANSPKVDTYKAHHATAGVVQRVAADLLPARRADLVAMTMHFNAQMKKAEETAAAEAREARLAEERRRAEKARLAREAAEAEASRQAQAAAQARQSQPPPEPRFRWCMRCAGTGTYAQYVEELSYGRTVRVQKQVRCDRCFGSGKLP